VIMAERKSAVPDSSPNRAAPRRGGGLFTGILIGLLLGIMMALAVAVWLNLRGSPFAEREAPTVLPAVPEPKPAAAPAVPAADDGEGTVAGEAVKPPSKFDFYDILPNKSGEPASTGNRTALPAGLYLQAGAFRNPVDADDQKARLALIGLTAVVQRLPVSDGFLHRIRVGPFASSAELDAARTLLKSNGIDSVPVRPGSVDDMPTR